MSLRRLILNAIGAGARTVLDLERCGWQLDRQILSSTCSQMHRRGWLTVTGRQAQANGRLKSFAVYALTAMGQQEVGGRGRLLTKRRQAEKTITSPAPVARVVYEPRPAVERTYRVRGELVTYEVVFDGR